MKQYNSVSVMKFGGSSFATMEQFAPVCAWIARRLATQEPGHRIVCVVSAPSGLTEQYRSTLLAINPIPSDRLIDAALPLADSLGSVLLAAALEGAGMRATVALGNQIGLRTDRNYTRAQLKGTVLAPLHQLLVQHQVVVVPGGQAAADDTGETTWMGKNSSDMSAIALAVALGCDQVEIYSDVPGVYSCDPNMVPQAYPLAKLSHQQAVDMSLAGAKVLHHRGVQYAMAHDTRIVCRGNSGDFAVGTILSGDMPNAAAVIPDARSQVFRGDADEIARAVDALAAASVPHVLVESENWPAQLCITCGFFDAPHFLRQRKITLVLQTTRLISTITRDGRVLRELVASAELGRRADQLHDDHCCAPLPAPPLCTQLAVLPKAGAVAHV